MGGSKQKTESTTVAKTPEQQAIANALQTQYLPLARQPGSVFAGNRVADMTGLQRNVVAGAGGFLPQFAQTPTMQTPLAGETQAATRDILTGTSGARPLSPEDTNRFFAQAVGDPAREIFQRDTVPGIQEAFAGPGFFGSARPHAEIEARGDLERELGAQRAALQYEQLQRGQEFDEARAGRQLAGISAGLEVGREPTRQVGRQLEIAGTQLSGLRDLFGFGEAEQTQEQREIFADMEQFAEEQGLRGQALDIVLQVLNEGIMSTSTATQRGPSFMQNLYSSFATGLGGSAGQGLGESFGSGASGGISKMLMGA